MNETNKQPSRRSGPPATPGTKLAEAAAVDIMPADEPVNKIELAMCAIVALALFVGIYLVPRPIGDLYVAFAGAQDVLTGQLGKIDDWSFANHQVWIDQNWGTHLLYYGAYAFGGPTGILLLKAAILLLMGAGVFLAVREHKASLPVALLIAGSVMIAGNAYLDLRPNLISLTFCPVFYWLLLRTRGQPHRIWTAVAFLWLWGNMHGGFIFGLALLGLWCLGRILYTIFTERVSGAATALMLGIGAGALLAIIGLMYRINSVGAGMESTIEKIVAIAVVGACLVVLRLEAEAVGLGELKWKVIPFIVAPLLGLVLVGLLNPYSVENLTHPFIVGGSLEWRKVAEWFPVFNTEEVGYGSRFEFFIAVGVLAGLGALRPLLRAAMPERFGQAAMGDLLLVLFSVAACGLVVQLGRVALETLNLQLEQRNGQWDGAIEQINNSGMSPQQKSERIGQYNQMRKGEIDTIEGLRRGTIIPLAVFAMMLVGTLYATVRVASKVVTNWITRHSAGPPSFGLDLATLLFALALGGMVIYMGFSARRFVPLAIIMMAPLLAIHMDWAFQKLRSLRPLPVFLACVAVLWPTVSLTASNIKHYLPDNPYYAANMSSMYDRMIFNEAYGHGAAEFINRNNISGNAIEEWRWEGFLHWRCPQLKLYVGGRAQQAYSEATYIHRMELFSGRDHLTGKPLDRVKDLDRLNVRLVIMPLQQGAEEFVKPLLAPNSPWTMLFVDSDLNVVLGDTTDPALAKVVEKIIAGDAWYPDAGIGAVSRAMCMSYRLSLPAQTRRDALVVANLKLPMVMCYQRLLEMAASGEVPIPWLLEYLRGEFARLPKDSDDPHTKMDILRTRHRVGELILTLTNEVPVALQPSENELRADISQMQEMLTTLRDMQQKWAN